MKPGEIFKKTMPFCWAKLLLGLATVVVSILIFALLMGIAWLFESAGVGVVMVFIWLFATVFVNFIIRHYIGFLVKAGHVAVITEAVVTGRVPDNQVAYGKQMVKDRFATSNVYFAVIKLVKAAVKQLQNSFERVGNTLGKLVPGMSAIVSLGKMFIGIALGYIGECCLGYTFFKKEQGAFRSAADGVVIYAQNWKKLLKDAAKTTFIVIVVVILATLITFLFSGLVFVRLLGWNGIIAFLIACFVASVIKTAFVDSYIMIKMMVSYMEEAPKTVITFDLYGKLCGLSGKFKQLFNKGQQEDPIPQPVYATAPAPVMAARPGAPAAVGGDKPLFCGDCGAKNTKGTKFCGGCGKPL
ncbi:MAG: zinc ribbon domain-containing protein [Defluviitaleaceae bacterium]|nr:zinc ribbon domain-containing protein [Defluviitaleaceae bacterium]